MKRLLVIVDMVNGFINEGALADKKIDAITPSIIKLTKRAIYRNVNIIAFVDTHQIGDEEFIHFPEHCIKGTKECELIPQLLPYANKFKIIEKNTVNGFRTKQFQKIIEKNVYDEIIVTGCCTDICVEAFVKDLLNFNKANNRSTKVIIPEYAVYTFDLPEHNALKCHKEALQRMEKQGAVVVYDFNKNRHTGSKEIDTQELQLG